MNRGPGGASIDLSREDDFKIGHAEVRPSMCILVAKEVEYSLEPLVAKVLVCLARRSGAVTSRKDLFEECWGDVNVESGSVEHAIAKVRAIGKGSEAYRVETVRKVGYQLAPATLGAASTLADMPQESRDAGNFMFRLSDIPEAEFTPLGAPELIAELREHMLELCSFAVEHCNKNRIGTRDLALQLVREFCQHPGYLNDFTSKPIPVGQRHAVVTKRGRDIRVEYVALVATGDMSSRPVTPPYYATVIAYFTAVNLVWRAKPNNNAMTGALFERIQLTERVCNELVNSTDAFLKTLDPDDVSRAHFWYIREAADELQRSLSELSAAESYVEPFLTAAISNSFDRLLSNVHKILKVSGASHIQ